MKQFFKFLLASCLGTILALVLFAGLGALIVGALASSVEKPHSAKPNTVLHLQFEQAIPERTNNLEMNPFDLKNQKILGLQDMLDALEAARDDANIKGVFLDLGVQGVNMGMATASVLRERLVDFKGSGKFIVAYAPYYTQGSYYLASIADEIYLNPMGGLDFRGFGAILPFYKNLLEKIGVEMQVFYAGDFKSATEPYRLTKMSDQNRLQLRELVESIYGRYLTDIGQSRNMTAAELRAIADGFKLRQAEDARTYGLVDQIGHRDAVLTALRNRLGLEEDDKIPSMTIDEYAASTGSKKDYSARDKVAVVYAEGTLVMGEGDPGSIGGDRYSKILREVRKDERVKAIVLRVNSRGGSVLASDDIWQELHLAKEQGLPVVVSMGDYAASGGYYISCLADSILVEPNTITGSIGVFAMLPNAETLLNDKLGITFDTVQTGRFSTGLTPFYPVTEEERQIMQASTDQIYEHFLKVVADGRGMTRDEVHAIAQGRVWTGDRAVELGLADRFGNLEDAIEVAVQMAGLEKYRTTEYPRIKEPLQQFIEEITGVEEDVRSQAIRAELGEFYQYYEALQELQHASGYQARLPFSVEFR